jgi:hypothetical protein
MPQYLGSDMLTKFSIWLGKVSTRKFLHSSQIYLAILIVTNLILGWLVFQDYGQSWDEPFFYEYAASIPGAYNLHQWLNGSVDIENYFGQSNLNLKMYGPAYLLLAHFPDEFFRKVLKVGSMKPGTC